MQDFISEFNLLVMIRWILFLCFFISTSLAFSQGFIVDDYRVDIYLHKAGYFDVLEKYEITFTERKHGIFRNIVTQYKLDEGGNLVDRAIVIDHVDVPGHQFTTSSFLGTKYNGQMEIKIGEEDKLVQGKQRYTIQYRVKNAFLFTDSTSQFYWNIKSSDWPAFFNHISFSIHLPDSVPLRKQDYFLYSGETGNPAVDETIPLDYTNGVLTGNSKANLMLMGTDNNLTVLIKMPSEYIQKPSPLLPVWHQWGWTLFLLGIVCAYFYVWRAYGKDRDVLKIVHYFPPKGMDPAMAGYLVNDQEDNSDLISLIPYWGSAGLLSLEEIPKKGIFGKKDTRLKKLAELPAEAAAYEKVMFTGLFPVGESEVLISSLKNTFYTTMNSAKSILKKEAQRYYHQTSNRISKIIMVALVLMAIVGMLLSLVYWTIVGGVIIVISCVVLLKANKIMQKRNETGDNAVAEVYGFQLFVKTAEEEKLRILLQDDPGYFEKSLGFALAFGLLKKWGSKFDHLNVDNPAWYHSTTGNAFSAHSFSSSFSNSISSMQSTMVSTPSSSGGSGGGSSGGGFGGGGGGSW